MSYILAVRLDNNCKCSANRSWAPWSLRSFEQVMLQIPERGGFSAAFEGGLPLKSSPVTPLYLGSSLEVKLSV